MFNGNFLEIQNKTGSAVVYQGVSYSNNSYVPLGKIAKYSVTGHKLWGEDSGRSMTGSNKGTLVGIFPKLSITLIDPNEDDMKAILLLTDQPEASVKYYDAVSKSVKTNSFYFGDVPWEVVMAKVMRFGEVTFSIIANERRT